MTGPAFQTLPVAKMITETRDAHWVVFRTPPELAEPFRSLPGQFLTVRIPSDRSGSDARCYSLSSAPHEGTLKVTVKRTANGYGSKWICDHLREGAELAILPPAG